MPRKLHPTFNDLPEPPFWHSRHSIRQALERDAWAHHRDLARRLEQRRQRTGPQRRLRWQDRTLLWLGIVLLGAVLLRIESAAADTWGLELAGDGVVHTALALDTDFHVEVTGLSARVVVVQRFRNDGDAFAEGQYRFPLPDGAAVDQLWIRVGERVLEGEIREREAARRVYQQARSAGQTTGLVEQERVNQFSTRLANIGPGEDIQVMIGFLADVHYEKGIYRLRLPTTFNRRWDSGGQVEPAPARPLLVTAAQAPSHGLAIQVRLLGGLNLAALESLYHDVDIRPTPEGYTVELAGADHRSDRDFELAWATELQPTPQTSLLTWDDGESVYAQLMLVPPADLSISPQSREVIFIIDTSGSMEGASLEQARSALERGLQALTPADRFNLVQFNSETERLFPQPVDATSANLQQARGYLRGLVANGGTLMAPALDAALTMDRAPDLLRQVVFITDGSVGNEAELLEQIALQLDDARLFTVAIGAAPNGWFMRKAAEVGRGRHTHIGQLDEVEHRMTALWEDIRLPAIQDLCIDWGMEAEFYPEILPDLYAGSPLWVTARLPAQPAVVSLCGTLNGVPWTHEVTAHPGPGNATLSTLWARRKVEALQDSLVFGADPGGMKLEMTRVALDYGLLTQHTSLVAVDRTPVRRRDEVLATGQVPSLLPASGSAQVTGFPATATGWPLQLLLSLLALAVSGALFYNPGTRLPVNSSRQRS